MGVIYKLKHEVVDFIVNEKKANPKVSCRVLAAVVSERYNVQVSKSSINSVIKEAQLSSPVGRRPLAPKKPKFQFPPEKKALLFRNNLNSTAEVKTPELFSSKVEEEKSISSKALFNSEKNSEELDGTKAERDHQDLVNDSSLSKTDGVLSSNFSSEKETIPTKAKELNKSSGFSNVSDAQVIPRGAGVVFLKAAEWELSSESILAKLIPRYMNPQSGLRAVQIQQAIEFLIWSEIFNSEDSNEMKIVDGFKAFFHRKDLDPQLPSRFLGSINDQKGFSLRLSNEIPMLLTEIAEVRLFLNNDSFMSLDANFNSFNVQSRKTAPLNKVLNQMTQQFITNVQTINLFDEYEENLEAYFNMVQLLLKNLDSLKKIAIFNEKGLELADFSILPRKRRNLIYGKLIDFNNLKEFKPKSQGELLLKSEERCVYYFEYSMESAELRAMRVSESPTGTQRDLLLLTNLSEGVSPDKIVEDYIKGRFFGKFSKNEALVDNLTIPQFNIYQNWLADRKSGLPQSDRLDFKDNCYLFLRVLHNYCARHFYPAQYQELDFSTAKERFYSLPGTIKREKSFLKIGLELPSNYEFKEHLSQTMQRVNLANVENPDGKRLRLYLNY